MPDGLNYFDFSRDNICLREAGGKEFVGSLQGNLENSGSSRERGTKSRTRALSLSAIRNKG